MQIAPALSFSHLPALAAVLNGPRQELGGPIARTFPLAIFEPLSAPNHWQPSALATGPFVGLQGGAVASPLTAEVESIAGERNWGVAVSATAWFMRPTPMTSLRTRLAVLAEGGRVSIVDNTLWPDNEEQPCATVRVTLSRERGVELPGFVDEECGAADPTRLPLRSPGVAHGRT